MRTRREQDARHREAVRAYYETGNEALLNPMLAELRPSLRRFLRAKGLKETPLLADLLQDTLVNILACLRQNKFDGKGSFIAWAFTLCWHQCTAYYVRKTNHITQPGMDEDPFLLLTLMETEAPLIEPADQARAGALVIAATDAVLHLDADTRTVVALHYYQGLPVKEAAQQLGITPHMFHSRLRRGLAQLQSWASTQPAPTADTYTALRHLDTGPLFQEPALRLAS